MALTAQQKKEVLEKYGAKGQSTDESGAVDVRALASQRLSETKGEPKQKPSAMDEKLGGGFLSTVADVGVGALKGASQTLQNVGNIIAKPLGKALGVDESKIGIEEDLFEPKNTAQKVGKYAERIAEFIVPEGKVSKVTSGLPKGLRIASQVGTDVAISTAQEGNTDNALTTGAVSAGVSVIPAIGKFVAGPTSNISKKVARNLESINLRLTPTQKLAIRNKEDEIVDFINKNKIIGSPETRLKKANEIVNKFEDTVQGLIKESGKKYTKKEIIASVRTIPEQYLEVVDNPEVYQRMVRDVDKFIDFVESQKSNLIDASRVNSFKRQYAKNARNKGGDTVINESREAISDGLYTILQNDVKELQAVNKQYSTALLTKKLLGKALGRNELGLVGNLISLSTGGALGGTAGGSVGAGLGAVAGPTIAKTVVGTGARSRVASGLQQLTEYLQNAQTTPAGDFIVPKGIVQSLINSEED